MPVVHARGHFSGRREALPGSGQAGPGVRKAPRFRDGGGRAGDVRDDVRTVAMRRIVTPRAAIYMTIGLALLHIEHVTAT